jgi:lipopolysaccharide transport system ATP-binding protein
VSAAVSFQGVSKRYQRGGRRGLRDALGSLVRRASPEDSFWALRDVTFDIPPGEALAVIGPNGAGKSTLLKLIGDIVAPTQGVVSVRGRVAALLELGAGFHPDLTGRENVYLNGAILGMRRREIAACLDSIVEFAELEAFLDMPVKRYSSGMYARLAFAVAVHVDPEVLLLDEVLAVGDRSFQEKSLSKAREFAGQARTVVFVSHNLYAVQSLCRLGMFLDRGCVKYFGPVREAVRAYEAHLLAASDSPDHDHENGVGQQWQSSGVRIERVQVCDPDGQRQTMLEPGEPLVIRLRCGAARRIERPTVAVFLVRSDGVTCAAASTRFDGLDLEALAGSEDLEVVFDPLTLGPGLYTISAFVYDQSHSYTYAGWERAAAFRLAAPEGAWVDSEGLYQVPHRWSRLT